MRWIELVVIRVGALADLAGRVNLAACHPQRPVDIDERVGP